MSSKPWPSSIERAPAVSRVERSVRPTSTTRLSDGSSGESVRRPRSSSIVARGTPSSRATTCATTESSGSTNPTIAVAPAIRARAAEVGFDYLDVGTVLIGADGQPEAGLFGADGLHLNAEGYRRWTAIVERYLQPASRMASAKAQGAS